MVSIFLAVAILAASMSAAPASAQSPSSSSGASTTTTVTAAPASSCAAQNIVDACLGSTGSQTSLCASTDYSCLCDKHTAILTHVNPVFLGGLPYPLLARPSAIHVLSPIADFC